MTSTTIDIPTAGSMAAVAPVPSVEDLSAYTFAKFAATYFVGNQTHQFSKRPLKSALLEMSRPMDEIAAQVRTAQN